VSAARLHIAAIPGIDRFNETAVCSACTAKVQSQARLCFGNLQPSVALYFIVV
jgi:hypothetical protein